MSPPEFRQQMLGLVQASRKTSISAWVRQAKADEASAGRFDTALTSADKKPSQHIHSPLRSAKDRLNAIIKSPSILHCKVMHDENDLIYSPLQQKYTVDGKTVEVCIYRMPNTNWTLEVVDQYNNSTVWDLEFNTDQEAFDQFLEVIAAEGIESMIGLDSGAPMH